MVSESEVYTMSLDINTLVMYVDYFIKVITNLLNKVLASLGMGSLEDLTAPK